MMKTGTVYCCKKTDYADGKDIFATVVNTDPLWIYLETETEAVGYVSPENEDVFIRDYNAEEVKDPEKHFLPVYKIETYFRIDGLPAVITNRHRNENGEYQYLLKFSTTMPWCYGKSCGRNGWYPETDICRRNVSLLSMEDIDAYM